MSRSPAPAVLDYRFDNQQPAALLHLDGTTNILQYRHRLVVRPVVQCPFDRVHRVRRNTLEEVPPVELDNLPDARLERPAAVKVAFGNLHGGGQVHHGPSHPRILVQQLEQKLAAAAAQITDCLRLDLLPRIVGQDARSLGRRPGADGSMKILDPVAFGQSLVEVLVCAEVQLSSGSIFGLDELLGEVTHHFVKVRRVELCPEAPFRPVPASGEGRNGIVGIRAMRRIVGEQPGADEQTQNLLQLRSGKGSLGGLGKICRSHGALALENLGNVELDDAEESLAVDEAEQAV